MPMPAVEEAFKVDEEITSVLTSRPRTTFNAWTMTEPRCSRCDGLIVSQSTLCMECDTVIEASEEILLGTGTFDSQGPYQALSHRAIALQTEVSTCSFSMLADS